MNPSSNFSSYRSSLKAALWRAQSAMEERERVRNGEKGEKGEKAIYFVN